MPKAGNNPTLHQTRLKEGEKAPAFTAIDQHGKQISLEMLIGKQVLLYFYPKNDTAPCTAQACNLRDGYQKLQEAEFEVIGVSADNNLSHALFTSTHNLPFSLIADVDLSLIRAYDVWGPKEIAGRVFDGIVRTTFVINPQGIIKHIIRNVNTKEHVRQILSL